MNANASKMTMSMISPKEFRQAFKDRYEGLVAAGDFAAADVDRLLSDDAFCSGFSGATRAGDLDGRLQLAEACLRWRCQDGIAGLTEAAFPLEALQKGSVYFHSEDREGHPIMYFRIQDCGKTTPEELRQIRQFIGWLLDQQHRRRPDKKIAVLFDMTNAGLANLNFDLVRFVVRAFQVYFPGYLGYLFVFEMPWVLTAAWKVIRSWLDKESQNKIVFLKRSNVQDYIAPDKLWRHMGGSDDYEYAYSPGLLSADCAADGDGEDEFADAEQSTQVMSDSAVHPPDVQPPPSLKIRLRNGGSGSSGSGSGGGGGGGGSSSGGGVAGGSADGGPAPAASSSYLGRYMSVSPADQVVFRLANAGASNGASSAPECHRVISLTSTWQQSPLAYKVKTTCPADYKVKPSSGLLEPGASVSIAVTFRPTSPPANPPGRSDKFQLLAAPVPSGLSREAALEALKSAQPDALMEHRLRCRIETPLSGPERPPDDQQLAALRAEVSRLSSMVSRLAAQESQRLTLAKHSLWLLAVGLLCLAFLLGWSFGRQAAAESSPAAASVAAAKDL